MTALVIRREDGERLAVGARLGQGGEGAVFATDDPWILLKLWHVGVGRDPGTMRSLVGLTAGGWPDPAGRPRVAAIRGLAMDAAGRLVGVTMDCVPPGLVAMPDLLTARDRTRLGIDTTPVWKLRLAARFADAVDRAHRLGIVMADVSPRHAVAHPLRARLMMLDADAWQLADGRTAPRQVSEDVWRPGADRPTIEGDRGALAVTVAMILLDGRHPCDGVRPDAGAPPSLVSDNLRDGYSHFGPRRLRPVPGTALAERVPRHARELLRCALNEGHADPAARPSAGEWVDALVRDASEHTGGHP